MIKAQVKWFEDGIEHTGILVQFIADEDNVYGIVLEPNNRFAVISFNKLIWETWV